MGYRAPDTRFGDGSDGHGNYVIGGGALQTMTKSLYRFASLTIGAGVMLIQKAWHLDFAPVCRIYSRGAVVINGILSVSAVAGFWGPQNGAVPGELSSNAGGSIGGEGYPPGDIHQGIYPIGGGASAALASIIAVREGAGGYIAGYSEHQNSTGEAGNAHWIGDRDKLIGPNQLYRYCAGCGGASADQAGGAGGGILIITAPSITFGESGAIRATGGDGVNGGGGEAAGGGGGGGYIETNTKIEVPLDNLDVSGGAGGTGPGGNGQAGMDGQIVRVLLT